MVNFFRRFQQPLLIAISALMVISMVVLYNLPSCSREGLSNNTAGTIYGRPVSRIEMQRVVKRFELSTDTMRAEFQALYGAAQTLQQAEDNFVVNALVLRQEAEQLGVVSAQPSDRERQILDEEILKHIQAMPLFQNNGAFDPTRYAQLMQYLGAKGMSSGELEELVSDLIRLERVKAIVSSTVAATPTEARTLFAARNQKLETAVVRFNLEDFKAAATVTDEDVQKLFEQRKETLKTPEKRKVRFVLFKPEATEKPLMGSERVKVMQALGEKAQEFALGMAAAGADFAAAAAKANLKVAESPFFEAGKPPTELEHSDPVALAAFKLTEKDPNSDVISTRSGFYVLQLAGTEAARPLPLAEAKGQLQEQLRMERGQEAMNLRATEVQHKLEAELKAGKALAEAAAPLGVKVDTLPAFSPAEPLKEVPEAEEIAGRAVDLADGQLSEFTPTQSGGGVLIYLAKRQPIDEAAFEKEKGALLSDLNENKREILFRDWLRARVKAANVQLARG